MIEMKNWKNLEATIKQDLITINTKRFLMDDELQKVLQLAYEATYMSEKDKKELEEVVREFSKIKDIEDLSDIEEISLQFDEVDIEDVHFGDLDIISRMPLDIEDIDFNNLDHKEVEKMFGLRDSNIKRPSDYKMEKDDSDQRFSATEHYVGSNWVEVGEGKYQTFVSLPKNEGKFDLEINLEDNMVLVSDPINEKVSTEEIPQDEFTDINAEKKEGFILITVS